MKGKKNRITAILLSMSLILGMLPMQAFATGSDVPVPQPEEFKEMSLRSLRNGGRRIAYYQQGTYKNVFIEESYLATSDSWYELSFVIEKSQSIALELYKIAEGYEDGRNLEMLWDGSDIFDGEPQDIQSEEFLGEKLGIVYAVPVTDNIKYEGDPKEAEKVEAEDMLMMEQVTRQR